MHLVAGLRQDMLEELTTLPQTLDGQERERKREGRE